MPKPSKKINGLADMILELFPIIQIYDYYQMIKELFGKISLHGEIPMLSDKFSSPPTAHYYRHLSQKQRQDRISTSRSCRHFLHFPISTSVTGYSPPQGSPPYQSPSFPAVPRSSAHPSSDCLSSSHFSHCILVPHLPPPAP